MTTTAKKTTTKKATAKKTYKARPKRDIHQEITDSIITLIEEGNTKGAKLWDNAAAAAAFLPVNAATGNPYNGVNRFKLAMVTMIKGYEENKWVTYKQAEAQKWQVRKGEKSVACCYYNSFTKEDKETGEEETKMFLKGFNVFNVAQLDGYEAPEVADAPVMTTAENCAIIKTILANTDVKMLPERGDMAFYSPSIDSVQMPPKACFTSDNAYYSVLMHELTHSTLHTSRLGRGEVYKNAYKTQKEQYAREELVAELGAAFLGAEIGCLSENLEFHANYIDSWLSVIKNDKKAIFKACSDAQKASDFILENWAGIKKEAYQPEEEKAA